MKYLVEDYKFFPAEDKVLIMPSDDFFELQKHGLDQTRFLIVTNVTRQVIMYLAQDTELGGTFTLPNELVLEHDCSTYDSSDVLQIFVEVHDHEVEEESNLKRKFLAAMSSIVAELRKIERHLALITEEDLSDKDFKEKMS